MTWTIHNGDALDTLRGLEAASFDAVLCDPPYGLSFMGKAWDHGVPSMEVWAEVLRVLKPGAHLLAFGGTRTFHRLTCAIEDAGFEIRDCVSWLYGSGFPKSMDLSKALDKRGGEAVGWFGPWLKAWRQEQGIAQKEISALFPSKSGGLTGCVANWELGFNMPTPDQFNLICSTFNLPFSSLEEAEREVLGQRRGSSLAVAPGQGQDRRQVDLDVTAGASSAARTWSGYGTALKPAWEPCIVAMKPTAGTFAENALAHGVAGLNIEAGRIEGEVPSVPQPIFNSLTGTVYGFQTGNGRNGEMSSAPGGRWPANLILDPEAGAMLDEQSGESPSRFFYTAKASRNERDAGLDGFEARRVIHQAQTLNNGSGGLRNGDGLPTPTRNHRPCLKPLDLNRYLASLILPPKRDTPRRILVPFSGSGSEMIGALLAGWDEAVGIEREADYCAIAEARLRHWTTLGTWEDELAHLKGQEPEEFEGLPLFKEIP